VSASLRTDGYSAFAAGRKWGTFYGGAVGYSISEEAFWKNSSLGNVFNFLKLRASYGLVGNNNGINDFGCPVALQLGSLRAGLYVLLRPGGQRRPELGDQQEDGRGPQLRLLQRPHPG
jgi:hypothetical protein